MNSSKGLITKAESIKIGNEIDLGKRMKKRKNIGFRGIIEENSNMINAVNNTETVSILWEKY